MDFLPAVRIRHVTDARPVVAPIPWPDGFDDFRETDAHGKDGPAFLPVTLGPAAADIYRTKPGKGRTLVCPKGETGRYDECVVALHALVLDYDVDKLQIPAEDIAERWAGYEHVIHSTWTPGRWRVVLPYARPHTPAEHAVVYAWALTREVGLLDASCKNPSRLFYLPTCRTDLDVEPTFGYNPGALLDVATLRESVDLGTVTQAPGSAPPSKAETHNLPSGSTANLGPKIQSPPPRRSTSESSPNGATGGGAADPYAGIEHAEQREDLALIEERCAFARHARVDAATLPEPEWYAWLSLVARTRGGDAAVHDIGSAHPQYSRDDTEAKYERAKGVGPATCAYVRGISPACKGCPVQVTSPVQLGRRDPTAEASDPQAAVRDAEQNLESARVDERTALVVYERARRALAAVRRPNAVASELDVEAAVLSSAQAKQQAEQAERTRKWREKQLAQARKAVSVEGLPAGADPAVWQRLNIGKDGRPASTLGNVYAVLDGDARWSSRLSYDAFALDVLLDGEEFPEEAATTLTARLSYDYALDTRTVTTQECVRAVARKREVHPVRDWLATQKWDGTPRVGKVLLRGFGVDPRDDEGLVALIGERFLLSLVARIMKPGAKVDTMLILTGAQGTFKSTSLRALVGQAWFASSKLDLLNKDSYINLRGKWLYEIQELGGVRRVEAHVAKAWLSNEVDRYRAPYDRRAADHPRQTVMAGTDNTEEVLMDPTGYRRYWPCRCTYTEVAWVEENRAQLFAEAAVLYGQGRAWWFDERSEETVRLRRWCAPFQVVHPWTDTVLAWLEQTARQGKYSEFTVVDVLTQALMLQVSDIGQQQASTVGGILTQVGCAHAGRAVQDGVRTTRYVRPAGLVVEREKVLEMIVGGKNSS